MSDSTTNLDQLSSSQAGKETTVNSLLAAAWPAFVFGRHDLTTSGLTWGYYGGNINNSGTITRVNDGTLTLANNATNYVECTTAGVVSSNTSAFTAGRIKLYTVVTSGGFVSSYTDQRAAGAGGSSGGGSVTSVTATDATIVVAGTGAAPTIARAALTGDVTTSVNAATIANNAVTNAKAAQMAAHTFKGNNTGSTANAIDLSLAQATAELNAFVGDSGSGGTKGLVPAPGSGDAAAGKFLKADGTFAVPAGAGDMVLASSQVVTGLKTFGTAGGAVSKFALAGATSGSTVLDASAVASGTATLPAGTYEVGYLNVPQNSQSTAYTTVLADKGKHLLHPAADTTARTFTIDSNANVAYPIGTAITFVNQHSAGVMTIAITSDTMRLAGTGATGSRTLAADGVATAIKITSTEWIISGTGLT